MALLPGAPCVVVASNGLPVSEAPAGYGAVLTPASNELGIPVTIVTAGGVPVVFVSEDGELAPGGSSRISMRNPLATDDTAKGYAANDHWLNTTTGALYKATSVSASAAVWAPVADPGLVLDAVTGAAAAYGVVKLRTAYAGNAFKVVRASDSATLDIGFLASGVADYASMDTFGAATTLALDTVYDQSGNGLDMTSDGSRPPIFNNMVGGVRGLNLMDAKYMILPAGLSIDRRAFTSLAAVMPSAGYYGTLYTLGTTQFINYWDNGGRFGTFNGAQSHAILNADTGPNIGSIIANGATDIQFYLRNASYVTEFPGAAATMTGGYVPRSTGTGRSRLGALIFYGSILSAENHTLARNALAKQFSVAPQILDNVTFVGDSITAGYSAPDAVGFAQQALPLVTRRDYAPVNTGVPSQLQADELTNVADYTQFVRAGAHNVAHVFSGTNDIAANATGATMAGTTASLCAALRSGGFNKIIVGTMLPRAGGFSGGQTADSFDTERLAYNTAVRAGYAAYADALADYGAHAIMGPKAAASNATYYADTIHPTAAGHAILTPLSVAAINSVS